MPKIDGRTVGYFGIANALNSAVFIAQLFALMALFDKALDGSGVPRSETVPLWLVIFLLPLVAQFLLTRMRRHGKMKRIFALQEWLLPLMIILALFIALWMGGEVAFASLFIFGALAAVSLVGRVVLDRLMK